MEKLYGRCRRCKQDKPANTFRLCEQCLPVAATRKRIYSVCGDCKREKSPSSVRLCKECLATPERRAKQAEWTRQYRLRKLAGVPSRPLTPSGQPRTLTPQPQPGEIRVRKPRASKDSYAQRGMSPDVIERHRQRERERGQRPETKEARRQRHLRNRQIVIEYYGGKCLCCGMSEVAFLTIDHTERDGATHRREQPAARELYSWLIKNGFPDGGRFRVLCVYCHHAVTHYGACPHDPERIRQ